MPPTPQHTDYLNPSPLTYGQAFGNPRRGDYRTEGLYESAMREWRGREEFYERLGLHPLDVLTVIFPEPEVLRTYRPPQNADRQYQSPDLERVMAMAEHYAGHDSRRTYDPPVSSSEVLPGMKPRSLSHYPGPV